MKVTAYKLRKLLPPQDDLREAILASRISIKEGDVVAISSKVVSIAEGRCVPIVEIDKEELIKQEADWYLKAPESSRYRRHFTIAKGAMVGSAGIDESNGSDHYILYPQDPFKSARQLRTWIQKTYDVKEVAAVITDSTSSMLRRGAMGFALAWDGIDPLRDYRGTKDLFDRTIVIEMANIVDALAASAVLAMGEGNEQTPIAVIRDVPSISFQNRASAKDQLVVAPEDDVFAPLFWNGKWKKGGA